MTPSQLIESLEQSGLVDPKILAKIRRELDNPSKPVKPKAVIKFLVDKGELTAAQGEKFLSGQWQPTKQVKPEPDFEVKQPAPKADFDTDDLTSTVASAPPAATPPAKAPKTPTPPDGTRVFDVNEALEDTPEVQVPVQIQATSLYDPLQDNTGFSSGPNAFGGNLSGENPTSSGVQSTFRGKKDRTDQWATKWIYIGGSLLAVLLVVGAVLALSVFREAPEKLSEAAEKSYLAGNYLDAVTKYGEFAEGYPRHERASLARVRIVQSLIWNAFSAKNFKELFSIAKEKIPTVEQEASFDLIKDDFSIWFPAVALEASESVLRVSTKKIEAPSDKTTIEKLKEGLAEAEKSGQLLDYLTGNQRKMDQVAASLEKYENNLKTIRGLINKETDYEKALKEINDLAAQNKPDDAFQVFNRVTRTYGDLGARPPLREAMKKVTASEINLITPSTVDVRLVKEEAAAVYDRQLMLVSRYGTPTPALQDEVLPYLIEGSLFAVSGKDGSILWNRFLGFESLMRPIWVDPVSKLEILAFDQRTHDILKLDPKNGALIWRATIGEPFVEPTIHAGMMYVATRSGSVLKMDVATGELLAGTRLPKKIGVSVAAAEQDPYLYVVGDNSNVYVLSREDLKCQEIYYLGHLPNQVRIAPIYWNSHLLVNVNGQNSELTVFRLENKGMGLNPLQKIQLSSGAMSLPPFRLGRNMLFVSDTGELRLIEMTTAEEATPVSLSAQEQINTRGASRAYVLAQGTGLWIASRGLAVFSVDKVKGQFRRDSIVEGDDTFLAPLQRIDDVLIHVRRRSGSRQISVSAVNAADMKMIWRSDFGAAPAGQPLVVGNDVYSVSSQGDLFALAGSSAPFETVSQTLSASDIDLPFNFSSLVKLGGNRFAALSQETPDFLSVDLDQKKLQLTRLQPPADKLASAPAPLSRDFVFPSLSGLILRLDENGRGVGAPFQPPLAPGETVRWNRPGVNQQDMILVGDEKQNVFLLDARQRGSLTQVGQATIEGQLVSPFGGTADVGFVVSEGLGKVNLLKFPYAEPFSTAGHVELPGRPVFGPVVVGDKVLLHLDNGTLAAYSQNLEQAWSMTLNNEGIAAILPAADPSSLLVAFESGLIVKVDSSGQSVATVNLGQPIRHEPLLHNGQYYFTTLNGSVLVVDRSKL